MTRSIFITSLIVLLFACSKGTQDSDIGTGIGPLPCDGSCADATSFLTVTDVETIIAQAVAESQLQGTDATIAVVDRVGNVLAVFQMNAALTSITIDSGLGVSGGLEGLNVIPDTIVAISKAVTGAYLSSEGNAFSTRTAGQIIQEHFNPGEFGQPSGPLFGVQFSNLPCSDLSTRITNPLDLGVGPNRSPLGLSADPGGLPLYKNGTTVGGIGVIADGVYGLDRNVTDRDTDLDELIAIAGSYGFAAPVDRRERVTLDGKIARFADVDFSDIASNPLSAATFASIDTVAGNLQIVIGYKTALAITAGEAHGQNNSGVRPDATNYPGQDAFVLVDNTNTERYPPIPGTDATPLTAAEVTQLINSALTVTNRSRAQIRRPVGSKAQVTISVVDTNGVILGIARTRDSPIFSVDVSVQKARTAAFFSGAYAAADLTSAPDTNYLNASATVITSTITIGNYVTNAQNFLGLPTALTDGAFAFSDRSGGNLSRPFFPDGTNGAINGPFSKPITAWSPFTNGLQLDLIMNEMVTHVVYVSGVGGDTLQNCTGIASGRLPNGIQIFPGSVPVYRGNTLIGGIGVSGDGVDQDDMIAFLGLHEASQILGTINNAPPAMRTDNIVAMGTRLRFVQCPQSPYIDSDETNVCKNK